MNEQEMIQALEATGNYRIVRRFNPVAQYHTPTDEPLKLGVYIDTETTGMDVEVDDVIEIGMVPFEFDSNGNIYRVLEGYCEFNDPGRPISAEITAITGITDEMVSGKCIDMAKVEAMAGSAALIICHNSSFDRPFLEKLSPAFESMWFGCSFKDINWREEGVESAKLEYLAYYYGWFYDGHRAIIDVQIGIQILSEQLPTSQETALQQLLDNARRKEYRLWAVGAPFDAKDELKKRGYRWSPGDKGDIKAWYTDILEVELETEYTYLSENIYKKAVSDLPKKLIDGRLRYSKRI